MAKATVCDTPLVSPYILCNANGGETRVHISHQEPTKKPNNIEFLESITPPKLLIRSHPHDLQEECLLLMHVPRTQIFIILQL